MPRASKPVARRRPRSSSSNSSSASTGSGNCNGGSRVRTASARERVASARTTRTRSRGTAGTAGRRTLRDAVEDHEDEEDELEQLQRFSNASAWQPTSARASSPPHLDMTPPPSPPAVPLPPRNPRSDHRYVAVPIHGNGDSASVAVPLSQVPIFALPTYTQREGVVAGASPTSSRDAERGGVSPSLLSALLQAEAERAGAAAAAAAVAQQEQHAHLQQQHHELDGLVDGGVSTRVASREMPHPQPPRMSAARLSQRRGSDATSLRDAPASSTAAPSPAVPTATALDYLTVCIGVVPLPGSLSSAQPPHSASAVSAAARRWWPWSRSAPSTAASMAGGTAGSGVVGAPDGVGLTATSGATAEADGQHAKLSALPADEAAWLAQLRDPAVAVRQLRPRYATAAGGSSSSLPRARSTSPALHDETASMASGATAVSAAGTGIGGGRAMATGEVALGWTSIFAEVPLVLPGAQQVTATRTEAEAELPSNTLVCRAAASISVMLG